MRRLFATVLLTGCAGGASIGNNDTANDNSNGADIPLRDPDETEHHDLASGEVIDDLDWMVDATCVPGTELQNYNGAHVFATFMQGKEQNFVVQAVPESDVDVSLYVMQSDEDSTWLPPDIGGDAGNCDESLDYGDDEGFGVTEAVFQSGDPNHGEDFFRVVVGIAGANHQDDGGFDVNVWYENF